MWARSLGRLVGAGQRSVSGISAKQWRLGLVFPENARRPEPRLVPSKARAGDGVTPAAAGSAQAAAASATSVEPGTIAAPPKEPRVLTVYSTKQRACELTEEDAGKIFRIRDYKKAFPEGIAGKVDFENESDLGIMHRREAIEIFDALREVDKEVRAGKPSSKPGFCLTGSRGMGKSYILNSVVQAASDLGWFVIFIPEVFKLTEGRYAMQHSPTREGLWDIPEISQMFLKGIEARNKELLSKTKRTLEWPYGDIEDNLLGYTRLGIEEVEAAPEALLFLLDEIRALKDVPVLLAIDQYNAFYAMCKGYMDEEGKHLPPHIFTCFRPFVRFPDASIKQGMMIIATSEGWMWHKSQTIREALLDSPLAREVTTLTRTELQILLARYKTVGGMGAPLDRAHVNQIWAYTGGLPGDCLKAAALSGIDVPLDDEDAPLYAARLRKGIWK